MADLTGGTCCAPAAQERCCGTEEKSACCDTAADGGACGCAEGGDIRERVRERYAAAARAMGEGAGTGSLCMTDEQGAKVFGGALYERAEGLDVSVEMESSLGCGVPTSVADLAPGETVLDLGSGAGIDVFLSARRVGPRGRAIGLDMTDEMLALARANADAEGAANAEFVKGHIEDVPLPDASVDVVISNCVINLAADKGRALAEAARVLRPGGRLAVSDVVADEDIDAATRADMEAWTGCVAGALTRDEYDAALRAAGLAEIEIRSTHRVHAHAASAIVRAVKPTTSPGV